MEEYGHKDKKERHNKHGRDSSIDSLWRVRLILPSISIPAASTLWPEKSRWVGETSEKPWGWEIMDRPCHAMPCDQWGLSKPA